MEKTLNFKKEEKYIESLFKAKKFIKKFKILVWGPSIGFFLSYTINLVYLFVNESITRQTLLLNISFIALFLLLLVFVLSIPNILLKIKENKLIDLAWDASRSGKDYSRIYLLADKIKQQKTTNSWFIKILKKIDRWVSEIY